MITYKITNTVNGKFYIGSAKTYGHYLMRIHNHYHNKRSVLFDDFRANPLAFTFEVLREDELLDGLYERELLIQHKDDPLLYNISLQVDRASRILPVPKDEFSDGERWSKEVKTSMSQSQMENWSYNEIRRETVSKVMTKTNAKKTPCPNCGLLMNAGNLAKHMKGRNCKG